MNPHNWKNSTFDFSEAGSSMSLLFLKFQLKETFHPEAILKIPVYFEQFLRSSL
jgi:hypothetical protein